MATNRPKIDQDKADEQPAQPVVNEAAPPVKNTPRVSSRIKGAYQLGGVWYAADGSTLAPVEIQQAHRAMDAAAAEARRKALLGGGE